MRSVKWNLENSNTRFNPISPPKSFLIECISETIFPVIKQANLLFVFYVWRTLWAILIDRSQCPFANWREDGMEMLPKETEQVKYKQEK